MNNKTVKTVNIDSFKLEKELLDYVDNDFVVVKSLRLFPLPDKEVPVRLDCFLMVFCKKGRLQFTMNTKTYLLEANTVAYCLPTVIIDSLMSSADLEIMILGFSVNFLSRVIPRRKDIWQVGGTLYKNPIKAIDDEKRIESALRFYGELIQFKITQKEGIYNRNIIQYLFSALFLEMMTDLKKEINTEFEEDINLKQADFIYHRFLEKVIADRGLHRSVEYFANELFYTSKYLSKVVKQVCGKNPSTVIHEHAVDLIKYQLKRTSKPIKEIADDFNFSNVSFFGKYVKAHTGMSPLTYRNSGEDL